MVAFRHWQRIGGVSPIGVTPLVEPNNNILAVAAGDSILRAITTVELGVVAKATGAAQIDTAFFTDSQFAYGLIVTDQIIAPSVSPTPFTNPVITPKPDWAQWEYLQPNVLASDYVSPEVQVVAWRSDTHVDTQFRYKSHVGNQVNIWLPWEIQDGSGLIGNTVAGVTYSVYARFWCNILFETP